MILIAFAKPKTRPESPSWELKIRDYAFAEYALPTQDSIAEQQLRRAADAWQGFVVGVAWLGMGVGVLLFWAELLKCIF